MNKCLAVWALAGLGICLFVANAAAEGIKEGNWSMTTVVKMAGMGQEAAEAMQGMEDLSPEEKALMDKMMGGMNVQMAGGGQGISTTTTKCLTNEDPVPDSPEEGCQETHTIEGNKVTFTQTCAKSSSTGEITYRNESMDGVIQSHSEDGDATIEIKGMYLGPCS